jgi:hypothetical protein
MVALMLSRHPLHLAWERIPNNMPNGHWDFPRFLDGEAAKNSTVEGLE